MKFNSDVTMEMSMKMKIICFAQRINDNLCLNWKTSSILWAVACNYTDFIAFAYFQIGLLSVTKRRGPVFLARLHSARGSGENGSHGDKKI